MSAVALAIGGSAVLGYMGSQEQSKGIESAAGAQTAADTEALAFQKEMWRAQQEQAQPWLEAGTGALEQIAGGQFDVTQDPGYQFRTAQGEKMLERQLAGMGGGATSGRGMMEAVRRGQEMGSQEYGAAYNRLASLAGVGQTAQQSLMGSPVAAAIPGTISGIGTNIGQAGLAQAGVTGSMYGGMAGLGMQGLNVYQQQNYLNQMNQPSYSPSGVAGDAYMPAYGGY